MKPEKNSKFIAHHSNKIKWLNIFSVEQRTLMLCLRGSNMEFQDWLEEFCVICRSILSPGETADLFTVPVFTGVNPLSTG